MLGGRGWGGQHSKDNADQLKEQLGWLKQQFSTEAAIDFLPTDLCVCECGGLELGDVFDEKRGKPVSWL